MGEDSAVAALEHFPVEGELEVAIAVAGDNVAGADDVPANARVRFMGVSGRRGEHTTREGEREVPELYTYDMKFDELPGGTLVRQGLADIAADRVSAESLLVMIGAPRLRNLGFGVPETGPVDPELSLYKLLAESDADSAHGRYNALIRLLVSFERAVESGA